jgi:hypothetical protein
MNELNSKYNMSNLLEVKEVVKLKDYVANEVSLTIPKEVFTAARSQWS